MSDLNDRDRDYKSRRKDREDYISFNETEKLIDQKIEKRLQEAFRNIGYDIEEYKELKKLRDDLQFVSNLRESSLERKSTLLKSLITALVGAVLGLASSAIGWFITVSHK